MPTEGAERALWVGQCDALIEVDKVRYQLITCLSLTHFVADDVACKRYRYTIECRADAGPRTAAASHVFLAAGEFRAQ